MIGNAPIAPKNPDGILRVISVGRLSQPKPTDEETDRTLEAIRRENDRMLTAIYPGSKEVRYLAEQISGLLSERETIFELWELVRTNEWDLIIAEDLGRVFRNPRWQLAFVQDAFDAGIRVICFADNLDTSDENWEATLLIAAMRHGIVIPDTRRRIKRTATETFHSGGQVGKVRAGYARVSKEDATTGRYGSVGLRMRRIPEFANVLAEIHRRFAAGHSPQSVVAWLNAEEVPLSPYATKGRWSVKLLQQTLKDPILHGTRMFRRTLHIPIYRSGKYRREHNPKPETMYVPALAHMSREEQESMLDLVGWQINWGGAKPPRDPHPRKGIPLHHSVWPGQAVTCSGCGDRMYLFGTHLRCRNAVPILGQTCWNHVLVPIAPLRAYVVDWLVKQFHTSVAFRDTLLRSVKEQLQHQQSEISSKRDRRASELRAMETRERNLRRAIGAAKELEETELKSLTRDLVDVTKQLAALRHEAQAGEIGTELPCNMSDEEISNRLPEVLGHLISTSFEFAEVLRGLVPRCEIVPVQALDTGQVHPRAKLTVRANLFDAEQLEELGVDLFEAPVHIRIMHDAVKLRNQTPRPTLRQIGAELKTCYMNVKRALAYHRLMEQLGVTEPFRELHEKPENASRWRHS